MEKLCNKLPYGKTHVAIASTHRFNCPATMAIETLEATSVQKCANGIRWPSMVMDVVGPLEIV
ncbi:hypothetical protein OUZ56_017567 [Daphnia magna]|uniref:Uncharacterized protein n=1 Tax=Daphnia magna TaxID=35525 RepID=A0ABR0AT37_9CRUS|nr:hypothetical protein OUZ56_017567 [Daphnia magna]